MPVRHPRELAVDHCCDLIWSLGFRGLGFRASVNMLGRSQKGDVGD